MSRLLKLYGIISFFMFLLNPLMIVSVIVMLVSFSDEIVAESNIEKCNKIIYQTHSVKTDDEKLNKQHQKFALCIADRSSVIFIETNCECSSPNKMLQCIDQYASSKSVSQMDILNAIASDCGQKSFESNIDQT